MLVIHLIHVYHAAWQSPLTQTVSPVASFSQPRIIICFDCSASLYVPDRILSSRCEAHTCAITIPDRPLAQSVAQMLSFPCYTFSLLVRAI
jgi:hypothetical protein